MPETKARMASPSRPVDCLTDPSVSARDRFDRIGFALIRGMVDCRELKGVADWVRSIDLKDELVADKDVAGASVLYAPPVTEFLLAKFHGKAEEITGRALDPSYSYLRIYKKGCELKRHTDRPSCEFTISLCVGFDGDSEWPIYLATPAGIESFHLAEGDALIFCGCNFEHWREPFAGRSCAQTFLHYVDQKSRGAGKKFDGRSEVGAPYMNLSRGQLSHHNKLFKVRN